MNVELPKWPLLLVKGKRITQEQADKVIVRTTHFPYMGSWDRRWNAGAKKALRIRSSDRLDHLSWETWDEVTKRLGVLDLEYLHNDRIVTCHADGPYGWCNWDGEIGSAGMHLMAKWPKVDEIHGEWRNIAHAFPFLDLTAQLARVAWDNETAEVVDFAPLVTWTIANGAAQMWDSPGELIREPEYDRDRTGELAAARFRQPAGDTGVRIKRLAEALRRCERG